MKDRLLGQYQTKTTTGGGAAKDDLHAAIELTQSLHDASGSLSSSTDPVHIAANQSQRVNLSESTLGVSGPDTAAAVNTSAAQGVAPEDIKTVLSYLTLHPDEIPTWFRKFFIQASPQTIQAVLDHFVLCPQDVPAQFVMDLAAQFLSFRVNDIGITPSQEKFNELMAKESQVTSFLDLYIRTILEKRGLTTIESTNIHQAVLKVKLLQAERENRGRLRRVWDACTGRDQQPYEEITSQLEALEANRLALETELQRLKALCQVEEQRNAATIAEGQQHLAEMNRFIAGEQAKSQQEMVEKFAEATARLLAIQQETLTANQQLTELQARLAQEAAKAQLEHDRFVRGLADKEVQLTADFEARKDFLENKLRELEGSVDAASIRATGAPFVDHNLDRIEKKILTRLKLHIAKYGTDRDLSPATNVMMRDTIYDLAKIQSLYGHDRMREVAQQVELEIRNAKVGPVLGALPTSQDTACRSVYNELIYRAFVGDHVKEVAAAMEKHIEFTVTNFVQSGCIPKFLHELIHTNSEPVAKALIDAGIYRHYKDLDTEGFSYETGRFFVLYSNLAKMLGVDLCEPKLQKIFYVLFNDSSIYTQMVELHSELQKAGRVSLVANPPEWLTSKVTELLKQEGLDWSFGEDV